MADPLSVAASVVGVVSFGLQTCQGLLSYYDDCKSFDDTVRSFCQKVAGLLTTLEICEEALKNHEETRAYTHVLESINVCRDGLDVLKGALDACQKHPKPHGFRANFHNYRQQALFTFKKSHLQRLESTVSSLQNDFQTTLSVLQTLGALLHLEVQSSLI